VNTGHSSKGIFGSGVTKDYKAAQVVRRSMKRVLNINNMEAKTVLAEEKGMNTTKNNKKLKNCAPNIIRY
jgi:hypothetical protein